MTHKFAGGFVGPSYLGDLITLKGEVVELREKAIKIKVYAGRQERTRLNVEPKIVAVAEFVFVARAGETYIHHGLELK